MENQCSFNMYDQENSGLQRAKKGQSPGKADLVSEVWCKGDMIFQKRKWKFGWLRVLVWPVRLIKSPCFQMEAPNLGVHLWSCQRKGVWPFSQWSYVFWCKQKQFPRTNPVFLNSSAMAPCQFLPALGAPDASESVLQWRPALRRCSTWSPGNAPGCFLFSGSPRPRSTSHTESLLVSYKNTSAANPF